MGFEGEVEQSIGRPCRQTNSRSKRTYELTSSIVPRGTSFHHGVELEFPPIASDPLGFSYRCYFPGPAELGAVNHSVVPDDCQQAAMQDAELLAKLPSDNQQRFDQNRRSGPASSPIRLKW